jgi:membrane dipeptidase
MLAHRCARRPTVARRADPALARALALLETMPLIDGHNDLPWVIRNDAAARGDVAAYGLARQRNDGDTDIPRLREGRVSGQVWAAYVPTEIPHPARSVLEQIDIVLQMQAAHPEVFLPVRRAADFRRAKKAGKIASMLAVEGGVGLENSLAPLRVWHAAGARLMTLCHNGTLDWVDSATDEARHGGLTEFGRAVVGELNRLGMMVDCAHVAPSVMRQVLEISSAPVVFSHSNARALCDHVRNVPDDVLDMVRQKGGLVMATFIPEFLSEARRRWSAELGFGFLLEPQAARMARIASHEAEHGKQPVARLEDVADHIAYLANRIGPDKVGIGSDFYGVTTNPQGLEDVRRFPHLLAEMIRRGWSDGALAGLAGGNFIRTFREVEREGVRLRRSAAAGRVERVAGTA